MTTHELHPRGAIAAAFGAEPTAGTDVFRLLRAGAARCDLGDEGLYLAEEIAAAAFTYDELDRAALGCLVLAAQIAARAGATRLPLDTRGRLRDVVTDIVAVSGLPLEPAALLTRIRRIADDGARTLGGVIGAPGDARPLIVDGGHLYTHKSHALECAVAARLAAHLGPAGAPAPGDDARARAAAAADDVRARPAAVALSDEQHAAVIAAAAAPLAVVTGGPGTGKTAVAGAIVRTLARLGATRLALAAPTGKAANRLGVSVARQLAAIADPGDADRALAAAPPAGQTVHRLLGLRGGADGAGDARGAALAALGPGAALAPEPLPYDAVLVDEASMLDLALTARLFAALAPGARLVLLGDARQLPSVDAGQVLADLVRLAGAAPWCARLERSFRAAADDDGRAILAAARAIDGGDARALWTGPGATRPARQRDPDVGPLWHGVELLDPGAGPSGSAAAATAARRRDAVLEAWYRRAVPADVIALAHAELRRERGAWRAGDAERVAQLLAHHDARRVLCATRGQPTGADAINARLHERLRGALDLPVGGDFLPGEPVILTANDHERGLYNGDAGVIARVAEDGVQRWRVVLRRGDELIALPLDAVRGALERAWALTVHKSQGSEYDEVLIVLPEEPLPIATRELIYTALTRARRSAVLFGSRKVLEAAAAASAPRHSGLPERVRAARGEPEPVEPPPPSPPPPGAAR